MYIKMNDDKSLIITIPTTIYRGEKNADLITFLVPADYQGKNIADCSVAMRYVLPNNIGRSDALVYKPEPYKGYLQFSTPVNARFTSEEGDITVWLTGFDMDDNVVFKTGETIVSIEPSKDIADYMAQEDLDQLDQLIAQVADLERRKADDITFDSATDELQLLSNGNLIGGAVSLGDAVSEAIEETVAGMDEVIYFELPADTDSPDDSEGTGTVPPTEDGTTSDDGSDDVIYF